MSNYGYCIKQSLNHLILERTRKFDLDKDLVKPKLFLSAHLLRASCHRRRTRRPPSSSQTARQTVRCRARAPARFDDADGGVGGSKDPALPCPCNQRRRRRRRST